jgi:hypothetical protein
MNREALCFRSFSPEQRLIVDITHTRGGRIYHFVNPSNHRFFHVPIKYILDKPLKFPYLKVRKMLRRKERWV